MVSGKVGNIRPVSIPSILHECDFRNLSKTSWRFDSFSVLDVSIVLCVK